jgi:hypothetical protein
VLRRSRVLKKVQCRVIFIGEAADRRVIAQNAAA